MELSTSSELAVVPHVRVATMAAIVHDLVAGDASRLRDNVWLRRQTTAAGLNQHECEALEALRVRLNEQGARLLDAVTSSVWQ